MEPYPILFQSAISAISLLLARMILAGIVILFVVPVRRITLSARSGAVSFRKQRLNGRGVDLRLGFE